MKEPPKEVKQKYMELQLIQRQVQQIHQQIQALDDFAVAKPGSESFVTLTPGLFVKAKIEQTDAVMLNVGGGAVVQKSILEAKKIVSGQTVELSKLQEELTEQLQKLAERAEKLQEELRKLIT